MSKAISWFTNALYYLVLGYFSYLMILITLQYIPLRFDVAFLLVKEEAIALKHYQMAFFSHVYTSIFVLLTGIPQFSKYVRTEFSTLHKVLGKLYVFLILFVAAPSGLIMALYANGGLSSQISFTLQSVLWFFFTFKAFQHIKNQAWHQHRAFMLRSYALTLSAISLRLFKWIIVSTIALPPMDTYRIVAWLGWLVNLIFVELWIIASFKKSSKDS